MYKIEFVEDNKKVHPMKDMDTLQDAQKITMYITYDLRRRDKIGWIYIKDSKTGAECAKYRV